MFSTSMKINNVTTRKYYTSLQFLFVCTESLTLVSDPTSCMFIRWLLFQTFIYISIFKSIHLYCARVFNHLELCAHLVLRDSNLPSQTVNKSTVLSLPLDISQNWLLQRTLIDTDAWNCKMLWVSKICLSQTSLGPAFEFGIEVKSTFTTLGLDLKFRFISHCMNGLIVYSHVWREKEIHRYTIIDLVYE
jgi:hypothetical protein